ncbi:MAG: ABC-2 family transporter protein [Promethearchaeota archaeon]|nr:MAG: ABC-2 family transporter protein [Candidatus Lokiarchaeota archaeon]
MNLRLLYLDELKGYYKSKVMIILWMGLPFLSVFFSSFNFETDGVPLSYLVGILIASIGGTLSSVMLSTSITSELNRHVYDLFLIRPIKRYFILIAKFLAVYTCIVIATCISLSLGLFIDYIKGTLTNISIVLHTFESLIFTLAAIAIACSAGILIGISVTNVAASAILSVYLGSQLSIISVLPSLILPNIINPLVLGIVVGSSVSPTLLTIAIHLFNKKQL